MDPVTGTAAAALSMGGSLFSGITGQKGADLKKQGAMLQGMGAQQTAQANSEAALYKAAVAQNNSILAARNAEIAENTGEQQSEMLGIRAGANIADIRAAQAANGLVVNDGTNRDVVTSAHKLAAMDTTTLMNNALRQAFGFKVQEGNYKDEATLDKMSSANALKSGQIAQMAAQLSGKSADIEGESSMLGAVTSFGSKWASFSKSGVFSGGV